MSLKNKIIILIFLSLIVIGAASWYFLKKPAPVSPGAEFPGEGSPIAKSPDEVSTEPEAEPEVTATSVRPRLYELHKLPVAGVGFIETGRGVYHTVATRYVEKSLGNIFETPLENYVETRLVNETRPRIVEALWGNAGKSVVLRYLDEDGSTILSRILNIGPSVNLSATAVEVGSFIKTEEVFLPDFIPFMSVSEDESDALFYLESGKTASAGSVTTFENRGSSRVFNSSFTEWLPQFPNKSVVTLTTKPSGEVPGYLYFLDQKTKSSTKILDGINGLTTLTNHDARLVLYSKTENGAPLLSVYNTSTRESLSLGLKTLPEKCAWGRQNFNLAYCAVPRNIPSANYPDQWYQGLISFSDDLWEIDINTMAKRKIMTPLDFDAPSLDIINPTLSSDDAYLAFINKPTGAPWVFRIGEALPDLPLPPPPAPVVSTTTTKVKSLQKTNSTMKKLK